MGMKNKTLTMVTWD